MMMKRGESIVKGSLRFSDRGNAFSIFETGSCEDKSLSEE